MSYATPDIAQMLPHAVPPCAHRKLLLFALRRVASSGLNDAFAANAFIGGFGQSFRRPLVLLRALMAEVSRISGRKLLIAPCCCPRMTASEAVLLATVADSRADPNAAHAALANMLGVRNCLGALSSAQALGLAFEDLGKPLGGADQSPGQRGHSA